MDAMLVAMEKLGIKNLLKHFDKVSKTTMDLKNEEAMNFVKKPSGVNMDFFAGKTKIFNFGTDEYTPTMRLVPKAGTTSSGINYMANLPNINTLAAMAKERGLQHQWPSTIFYYEDKDDMLSLTKMSISYWSLKAGGDITASPLNT